MTTLTTDLNTRHAATSGGGPITDGQALRFLLAHRLGRLMTEDIITTEPHVTPVHYVFDQQGDIVTLLPAASAHAEALRRGATLSLLSVHGETLAMPQDLAAGGAPGAPGSFATRGAPGGILGPQGPRGVQAEVEAELIEDLAGVRDILRRQITSVLHELPQRDKSDPVERAAASSLSRMVGVRLRLLRLHPRPRPRPRN